MRYQGYEGYFRELFRIMILEIIWMCFNIINYYAIKIALNSFIIFKNLFLQMIIKSYTEYVIKNIRWW